MNPNAGMAKTGMSIAAIFIACRLFALGLCEWMGPLEAGWEVEKFVGLWRRLAAVCVARGVGVR
ncbi:MAG: hypothetical protein Q4A11_05935 [Brachymonas sp.]|nr:hypothetical protein [Brachymonas sp.]